MTFDFELTLARAVADGRAKVTGGSGAVPLSSLRLESLAGGIGIYTSLPSRLYGRVARNERGGSLNVEMRMSGCGYCCPSPGLIARLSRRKSKVES